MPHAYWNDWYFGWGWLLWFGFIFLLFSSVGNWGYAYRAHRRFGELGGRTRLIFSMRDMLVVRSPTSNWHS
jgi:hypothetical protein